MGAARSETIRWGAHSGTVRRHVVGSERSLAFQTRLVSCLSISQLSAVASDDVTVNSRELARSSHNLAIGTPTRLRRSVSAGTLGSGSVLPRVAHRECSSPHCGTSIGSFPNRRGGWSRVGLCATKFGQNHASRAIGLQGGVGAHWGAFPAHLRPRGPRLSAGRAGCCSRASSRA